MGKAKLRWEDYVRAESFLSWNLAKRVYNAEVKPIFLGKPEDKGEKFWYRNMSTVGKEFKFVDPEKKVQRAAFDHMRLASSLSKVSGVHCTHDNLPFDAIEYVDDEKIQFKVDETTWTCDLGNYTIEETKTPERTPGWLMSPDEKWAAFRKDFNIWVKEIESGDETQLTKDGEQYFDYGSSPESNTLSVTLRPHAAMMPPMALWSKNAKKLVTQRLDQRKVKDLHLLQNCPPEGQRPVLHTYKYAMVGDEHLTQEEIVILEIDTQKVIPADCGPADGEFMGPVEMKFVWWGEDDKTVYFARVSRDHKTIHFFEIDAETGESKLLLKEEGKTYVELTPTMSAPNVKVIKGGKAFIWPSERDGWFNLYRYDAESGELLNPITTGPFVVWEIKYVDEQGEWVYFMGGSREPDRDPYYKHLYRVQLDGTRLQLLTPEEADHNVTFSHGGKYFVDTFSCVDQPPVTVLRAVDGSLVFDLEKADTSQLDQMGWIPPEPFSVKARDGITDIYGVIFRPSHFDPEISYPVIDAIYPGPQHTRAPKAFMPFDQALSIAELGFIVVTIDGLGNMGRSKANHDVSYGKFTEAGGLEDHIKGLRQLAERYPYMDLSRVGIYGHSGGGFASTKAILKYPEFYKVAVSSAGNHDQRGYLAGWGELYNGLLDGKNFVEQANPSLAGNLRGKLLLAAGDMDDNVHMALTMQVVDALIKANKDFDMLILPNRNHMFMRDVYFIRKIWDYFVTHLLGGVPPQGYAINEKDVPPLEMPF